MPPENGPKRCRRLGRVELPDEQRLLYDYVVVATGRGERQTKTLADEVYHFCKRWSIAHFPTEGDKGWHLIDCHQVICHAFTEETVSDKNRTALS